jgi:transposase
VIGIDDWAWRKGHRYGTLICDLERREVIDLLPDREPATVTARLAAHPSVEIIACDCGGGYGAAAARGRPDAVQVADRWHLMENASAAFLLAVRRRMRDVRRAFGQDAVELATLTAAERIQYEGWKRRAAEQETIHSLHTEGIGIKEIVRRTGRSRKLARDVLRGGRTEPFRPRASSLEP